MSQKPKGVRGRAFRGEGIALAKAARLCPVLIPLHLSLGSARRQRLPPRSWPPPSPLLFCAPPAAGWAPPFAAELFPSRDPSTLTHVFVPEQTPLLCWPSAAARTVPRPLLLYLHVKWRAPVCNHLCHFGWPAGGSSRAGLTPGPLLPDSPRAQP